MFGIPMKYLVLLLLVIACDFNKQAKVKISENEVCMKDLKLE